MKTVYDLRLNRGASFHVEIEPMDGGGQGIDLSGYTALSQIRETSAAESVLAEFSVAMSGGVIHLSLSPEQTGGIGVAEAVWDCLLRSPDGEAVRLIEGRVFVSPEVSR